MSVDKNNYFEIDNTIECHKYLDFAGAQHTAGTIPLFSVWATKCHLFRASLIIQLSHLVYKKT